MQQYCNSTVTIVVWRWWRLMPPPASADTDKCGDTWPRSADSTFGTETRPAASTTCGDTWARRRGITRPRSLDVAHPRTSVPPLYLEPTNNQKQSWNISVVEQKHQHASDIQQPVHLIVRIPGSGQAAGRSHRTWSEFVGGNKFGG